MYKGYRVSIFLNTTLRNINCNHLSLLFTWYGYAHRHTHREGGREGERERERAKYNYNCMMPFSEITLGLHQQRASMSEPTYSSEQRQAIWGERSRRMVETWKAASRRWERSL